MHPKSWIIIVVEHVKSHHIWITTMIEEAEKSPPLKIGKWPSLLPRQPYRATFPLVVASM